MTTDETLQISIGDAVIQCQTADDKVRLEPVGGILADGSTEGYRLDELDKMVDILGRYKQPGALEKLKRLVIQRRQSGSRGENPAV